MYGLFITCAVVGGSILVMQFLLNLAGFAGDGADFGDGGHADIGGGHAVGDLGDGGDFSHHSGAQDGGGDFSDGDLGGPDHHGHTGDDAAHSAKAGLQLARYITLQTMVAFLTFFGLGGWAALENDRSNGSAIIIAAGCGIAFMFAVGYAFQSLRKLEQAGNESIHRTVGCRGRVYLRIPAENSGAGKATITSQGRTIELKARTPGPELRTGTTIQVSRVLDRQTVEVIPVETPADLAGSLT